MRLTNIILAICGVCGLVAIVLGLAVVSTTYAAPPGTEPPKITDWMQGWGSVLGIISAIIAAALTAGLLLHEMSEARRARTEATKERKAAAEDRAELIARRDEERKSLARFIMTGTPSIVIVDKEIGNAQVLLVRLSIPIHNTGSIPVRDLVWKIKITSSNIPLAWGTYELFLPDPPPAPRSSAFTRDLPADPIRRIGANFSNPTAVSVQVLHRETLIIELRFTDANGRRWRRINNGDPELIAPDEMDDDTLPFKIHKTEPRYYKSLREDDQGTQPPTEADKQ